MSTFVPTKTAPVSAARSGETVQTAPGLVHFPALDGLRGLAVALVLAFHAGIARARGGFLGVSVFFTLSGFLITRLLLSEHARRGSIDLRAFWGRRFRRLLPASLLCLAGVIVFGFTVATADQRLRLPGDVASALFSVENWHFVLSRLGYVAVVGHPSPVEHFWSLAIEEQYYLLFPPLLFLVLGRGSGSGHRPGPQRNTALIAGLSMAVAGSIVAGVALFHPGGPSARAYYDSTVRASELLVGCLLAVVLHRRGPVQARQGRVGLAIASVCALVALGVVWSTFSVGTEVLYRGGLAVHALLVAVLITAAAQPLNPMARLFGIAPLRALGRISYGVYLFHWPIFLWLDPARSTLPWAVVQMARLALTVTAAAVSYNLLEMPIRRRPKGANRHLVVALSGTAATLGLVAFMLPLDTHSSDAAEANLRALVRHAPRRSGIALHPPPPPLRRAVRLIVAGDSFAAQLLFVLGDWSFFFPDRMQVVGDTAEPGCGLLEEGRLPPRDNSIRLDNPACRDVIQRNRDELAQDRPNVILVVTGLWDVADRQFAGDTKFRRPGDPVFDDHVVFQYQRLIDLWRSHDLPVLWAKWPCIRPAPLLDGGPLPSGFDPARLRYLNERLLPRVAAMNPSVHFVDLSRSLCPDGVFRAKTSDGKELRGPDGLHLGAEGGALARDQLLPELFRLAANLARASR